MIIVVDAVEPPVVLEAPAGTKWIYVCRDGSNSFVTHDPYLIADWWAAADRKAPALEFMRVSALQSDDADEGVDEEIAA